MMHMVNEVYKPGVKEFKSGWLGRKKVLVGRIADLRLNPAPKMRCKPLFLPLSSLISHATSRTSGI
jgi:hypothetical protein